MALFDPFPETLAAAFTNYLPQTTTTPHLQDDNNNNNNNNDDNCKPKPFVTLTYASSLDSQISLDPGVQTLLSGPLTKHFTHHLRSHHAAILVGVNTAIADDPGLNCRIRHIGSDAQPRPIILDPQARWLCSWLRYPIDSVRRQQHQQHQEEKKEFHDLPNDKSKEVYSDIKNCRLLKTYHEGKGSSPWVLVRERGNNHNHSSILPKEHVDAYEKERTIAEKSFVDAGGYIIYIPEILTTAATTIAIKSDNDNNSTNIQPVKNKWSWSTILSILAGQGITSLMVEGGASVINDLLSVENLHLVDSVIITIAPVFLGQGGVVVSPPGRTEEKRSVKGKQSQSENHNTTTRVTAVKFKDVKWCVMENDVVMVARPVD